MYRILSFCFLLPSIAYGQVVKAQLIDFTPDKIGPYCGYSVAATMLKFRLLESVGNLKNRRKILVLLVCPREVGENAYVNKGIYLLTLNDIATQPKWVQGAKLTSDYEKESLPRFWGTGLEQAP
jgi:hypothetical protein